MPSSAVPQLHWRKRLNCQFSPILGTRGSKRLGYLQRTSAQPGACLGDIGTWIAAGYVDDKGGAAEDREYWAHRASVMEGVVMSEFEAFGCLRADRRSLPCAR